MSSLNQSFRVEIDSKLADGWQLERLTQPSQRWVNRVRSRLTPLLSTTHHSPEPTSTPSTKKDVAS